MTRYAVVDLETTGHSPKSGDQIIEIGIVIVENSEIVDEYSTYINPGKDIPAFITNLTGITDEAVVDAPSFHMVAEKVKSFCKDAHFVAHQVKFDLGFLNEALLMEGLDPIREKVLDTVELARVLTPLATGFKLNQLAEYYNINHKRPHRALSDAYVTALLLIKLLDKARKLPVKTLEQLLTLEAKFQSNLYDILKDIIQSKRYEIDLEDKWDVYQGIALKKIKEENRDYLEKLPSFDVFLTNLIGEKGRLKSYKKDFEYRESQKDMSNTIFHAFEEKRHALLEAETGTGKTISYLIPAIYQTLNTGKRVLISTYTTQLQAQAMEKEIPLLQQAIEFPFQSVVMKGKNHYLSLKRFSDELQKPIENDNYDVVLTKALLLVWLTETDTGDIDELMLPSSGKIFWRKINAEAEILDPKSSWYPETFYVRMRNKAQNANLIVTNHALLCTEIANDFKLLPTFDYCVIDEAHHLEKTASKQFGSQLSYLTSHYLINELKESSFFENDELLDEVNDRADELFRYLFSFVMHQHTTTYNDVGRIQFIFEKSALSSQKLTHLTDLANRVLFGFQDLLTLLNKGIQNENLDENSDIGQDLQRYKEQLEVLILKIRFFLLEDDETYVKWIEIESMGAKNSVFLYSEPLEVSNVLTEQLYSKKKSVVLTSATMTMNNSFKYMIEKNGLEQFHIITKQFPSPFSMKDQVKLLIPNDLPNIRYDKEEDFITAISYSIYELAQITQGRMLVLFTSYQMLKKTHEMLVNFTDQDDFMIIAQGISSGSRERLKKNFQSFEKAILLGTSSFWEGIDIPGEDLSAVVIVRLPFEPPNHPVYNARAKYLKEQKKNPFMEMALPNAVIRFKQGFGRLIRSNKDSGIIFVCDVRIMQSRYGHYFLESIPEVPVIYEDTYSLLQHAKQWFTSN